MTSRATLIWIAVACAVIGGPRVVPNAGAQEPYSSGADFAKYAEHLRDNAVLQSQPKVVIQGNPSYGGGIASLFNPTSPYPWKSNIVTTVFWVGEPASTNNPVNNVSSSWDLDWALNFGGMDDPNPTNRRNFLPMRFTPRLNPFYFALPYNDVTKGSTKPEARVVIPWYRHAYTEEGKSVCRDRWIAIRNPQNQRICFAQWSDCGPFRTDHWQYVFGDDRPRPNLNQGAGLDVSPAVRDYLGLNGMDVTDWKFVEFQQIPRGPWALYGANNTFLQDPRNSIGHVASATATPTIATQSATNGGPQVSVH